MVRKLNENKFVLISGASSGIGLACAEAFAASGFSLVLCARRLKELGAIKRALVKKYKIKVHVFALDVSKKNDVARAVERLPKEFRAIDILVNNAGLAVGLEKLWEGRIEDWERMIDTNVKGLLYLTRSILPGMVARNLGHIINIGSIAGHAVYSGGNVYCATKHAVDALSRGLKRDLEGTQVRVSTVDPGAVKTNFSNVRFKGNKERADKVYQNMRPLIARDIAEIVHFCATRPSHVNISEVVVLATDQPSLL